VYNWNESKEHAAGDERTAAVVAITGIGASLPPAPLANSKPYPIMNTRRHFLATVLGAGAASALAGDARLSPKGGMIRFGLVTYQWGKDWDIPTIIRNCAAAKVHGVELRVEHAHHVTPALTPQQRAEVRARFGDSPVKVLGLGTNFEFHSPDAATVKQNIEGAKAYLELSHDIGGTGVKVKPNALPKEVPAEQTLARIGKALGELKGGVVSGVKITSEKGCDSTIQNPWPDRTVRVIRNGKPAETVSGPRFTLKTVVGENIELKEE
jgi:hypothetical protein